MCYHGHMSKTPQIRVGESITVVVKNRVKGMLTWRPLTSEFQGTVVASPSWVPEHSFCMTGERFHAMRVIRWDEVVEFSTASGKQAVNIVSSAPVKAAEWQIAGSKGAVYTVTQNRGNWRCNCVAGQFNRACKHVAQAQKLAAA